MVQPANDLLTQVEYYLSDKNLTNDKFFHEKIKSSTDVLSIIKRGKIIIIPCIIRAMFH